MKKKRYTLWLVISLILVIFVFPYAKVELLSINAEKKLERFDLSCFDNVYCEGTPKVYDCKIYSYLKEKRATALYVFGDCEFGVMVKLEWNNNNHCWELVDGRNMWSVYGGSAQEFYWPLYYADQVYPLLDDSNDP